MDKKARKKQLTDMNEQGREKEVHTASGGRSEGKKLNFNKILYWLPLKFNGITLNRERKKNATNLRIIH